MESGNNSREIQSLENKKTSNLLKIVAGTGLGLLGLGAMAVGGALLSNLNGYDAIPLGKELSSENLEIVKAVAGSLKYLVLSSYGIAAVSLYGSFSFLRDVEKK